MIADGRQPAFSGAARYGFELLVHDELPGPGHRLRVGGHEVGTGYLSVDHWLPDGLVHGMDEPFGVLLATGIEALGQPGGGVVDVVGAPAPTELAVTLLHLGLHGFRG